MTRLLPLAILLTSILAAPALAGTASLGTAAERSGFHTTGRFDEVIALCDRFQKTYPMAVRCIEFGRTPEGRPMLALVASRSGALNARQAHDSAAAVQHGGGGRVPHGEQRVEFALEAAVNVPAQVGLHAAFHEEARDERHQRDDERHRDEKSPLEPLCAVARGGSPVAHGKSTFCVVPAFTSTVRSKIFVLLTHAFSLCRPGGTPVSR